MSVAHLAIAASSAPQPAPLSPGRERLAVLRREEIAHSARVDQSQAVIRRASGLVDEEQGIIGEIVDLEAAARDAVADWARAPAGADAPQLPDASRMSAARKRLDAAHRLAVAAKAALPELQHSHAVLTASFQRTRDEIEETRRAVLIEEAGTIAGEIAEAETLVMALRIKLIALGEMLSRGGARSDAQRVATMLNREPPAPELRAIESAKAVWSDFDARLRSDSTATLGDVS